MIISHHIAWTRSILRIPPFEVPFFPWNCPNIIERRVHLLRDPGNKGRAAVGLSADRCSGGAVNVNLSPQSGALGITQDNRTHTAVLEANGRDYCIVHFDSGMVIVIPIGMQFRGGSHEPTHQVEVVRRLAYDYTAAFALPGSTPRIGKVVRRLAPSQHGYNREHGFADFSGID